jgi:alpha-ketoglutarate-dependent taurine dioxygenase
VQHFIQPGSCSAIPTIIATAPTQELESLDRNILLTMFKQYGAILFRSFSIGAEAFQSFVKTISKTQTPYPGDARLSVSQDGMVQTVPVGNAAIPLHSELSHTPFRPDVCWFYCVKAPTVGSETTLCDGSMLASGMPVPVIDRLKGKKLLYKRTVPRTHLEQALGTKDAITLRKSLEDKCLSQIYEIRGEYARQTFITPVLHLAKFSRQPTFANNIIHNFRAGKPLRYPTFADGSAIPESLILEIYKVAAQYTVEVQWRDHDLLMFDNTRFMHGRRPIVDPERTIWTQFSDLDL